MLVLALEDAELSAAYLIFFLLTSSSRPGNYTDGFDTICRRIKIFATFLHD